MKEESSHCLTCLCCLLVSDHIDINRHREGFGRRDSTYTGRQSHASQFNMTSFFTSHKTWKHFRRLCCWIQMGLNYITRTSIKKHQHFHSHLIFILQIHFVSINGYRCDKYLDLQKIKNTFQECLQHVHKVTHECLQLIFSRWIKQRPVINDIRGLKTQMTYQGISIYWILCQWMQNLYRYCTWLKYHFYFNWIFVETQFKKTKL